MTSIRQRLTMTAFAAALPVAGCALPDYQLPAGFSSTYYRHLQGTAPVIVSQPSVPRQPMQSATEPRSYMPPPPAPGIP